MVREQILLPVGRRAAVHREPAFENQGVSAQIAFQREVRADREISASVSRRVETEVSVPVDIFLYLSADGAVKEVTRLVDLRVLPRQVIFQFELRVGVHVDADAGVERPHDSVPVPGLRLHEEAVRNVPLVDRVTRLRRVDEPVIVIMPLRGDEIAVLVPVVPFIRIRLVPVGVDLAPRTVLERMADIHRREVRHREIALREPLQRDAVGLRDEEGVVAIEVPGLGVGQPHRHARRHLERRVRNGPLADHAAVLLLLDVVVVVARMDRIPPARVADGHRKVVVLGPRPDVLAARAPRLVVDVETRRRRDVLRMHDAEILLTETLLPRLRVIHPDHRLLRVVEGHVLHVVGVRVVGTRKTEVKELRTPEIVQRQRRLAQSPLGDVAHVLPVERIVDPVIGQRGVQRPDLDAVEIAAHVPFEVVQRADRVIEKIGLERLADFPFLLGGVLRLLVLALLAFGLLVGIAAVEVTRLAVALRALQGLRIEALGAHRLGRCKKQTEQERQQYAVRKSRHVSQRAEIRGKCN